MPNNSIPHPTGRETEILKILWDRGEATVRQVHEEMRASAPIVQNTVQAFLRTMEEKGLVQHRLEGRAFVYRATVDRHVTAQRLAGRLLNLVFDGAVDQLVDSLFSAKPPNGDELRRLEELIHRARSTRKRKQPRGPKKKP